MVDISHNPHYCCGLGMSCLPCDKCVRGIWITLGGFNAGDDLSELGCDCTVNGTYYVPATVYDVFQVCYLVSNPENTICRGSSIPWQMPDSSVTNCTEGGKMGSGALHWRIYARDGNLLLIVSFTTAEDFFAGGDFADFIKEEPLDGTWPPDLTDCSKLNGDVPLQCPTLEEDPEWPYLYCVQPAVTCSVVLDFGPCPDE